MLLLTVDAGTDCAPLLITLLFLVLVIPTPVRRVCFVPLAVVAWLPGLLPTPTTRSLPTARKDHFDFVAIPLVSFRTFAPATARA